MRQFSILTCLALFIGVQTAKCQSDPGSRLHLGIGKGPNELSYQAPTSAYFYDFSADLTTLSLFNKYFDFNLSYGTQKEDLSEETVSMKLLEGVIQGGPNIPLINKDSGLYLRTFIPLRLGLEYRFASVSSGISNLEAPNLYLLDTTFGLGLGMLFRPEFWNNRLTMRTHFLSSAGVQNELGNQFEEDKRWLRNSTFETSLTFDRVLGGLGLVLGYGQKSRRWSSVSYREFEGKKDSLLSPGELPVKRKQIHLRAGIVWQVRAGIK